MLKISTKDSNTKHLLVLEGKLVAPWTDELRSICHAPQSKSDGRELIIDLKGVTDISTEGEETLLCLMAQGAKFRGTGVFMKQVLKEIARRLPRNDGA